MLMTNAAETSLERPMGAASAYGTVIRRTESPREIEYRVMSQATAALEAASGTDAPAAARAEAIHRNRQLWLTLALDCADDSNQLSPSLRASILSLAIWVNGESSRVLREDGVLDNLIETNRIIMKGLAPAQLDAAPCP